MSLILRTDVTSVKIHENFILAGIGSSVNIFENVLGRFCQRLLCLNGQKIYGFVLCKTTKEMLVFGGKQFTVIAATATGNSNEVVTRLFAPVVCEDWFHSGVWIDDAHVALLTAHNVVQKWNTKNQTLSSQYCSKDNSILYSGLLLSLNQEVLVMAGTVFSEVIVHVCGDKPLHWLEGHKGVIFSISCSLQTGTVVTTSDDRSIRIWGPNITSDYPCDTIKYWENIDIVCKHELYGHTARVMRSCIGIDKIVSVGEDSAICFWNYDGSLAKKIVTHQNGCIWSADIDDEVLVTGGGDCAVMSHPLTLATEYNEYEILDLGIKTPKSVTFTARGNIFVLNENNEVVYYNVVEKAKTVYKLSCETTFKLVSASMCRELIAVANMNGKLDIFAENCEGSAGLVNTIDTKLTINRILSMQWVGSCHLVLCSENGAITVLALKDSNIETYADFMLPTCRERWLTASAIDDTKTVFVVGDRCSNIHIYIKGQTYPSQSFSKVHGRYGPTSITIRNNDFISTGRDGTVRYFSIDEDKAKLMSKRDLEFKWIEKFFDNEDNLVCGFQERVFIVYNLKTNFKLLEVTCGGGHRAWDAILYGEHLNNKCEKFIKLVYLKNSEINIVTFQLSKMVSQNIVNSSHSKEINCLKTLQNKEKSSIIFISGGEDTTLRISVNAEREFKDVAIFKQLSSIRTLKTYVIDDNSILIISAGGRAQICVKIITLVHETYEIKVKTRELIDYMIKGTDKMRKGNQNWRNCSVDFDPETRIMDVECIKIGEGRFKVFAGCSDATLRIFILDFNADEATLELTHEVKYHKTCILKTNCITFNNRKILVTCSTRGEIAFWDVTDHKKNTEPIFMTETNKSGINSFVSKVISNERLLIASGGDDNAMHLVLLDTSTQTDLSSIKILDSKVFDKHHSSEITGLCLEDRFILSTSVDQRITLFEWGVENDHIRCTFLSQTYSDVADVHGMDLISSSGVSITVCVFGKGIEVIEIPTPQE